MKKFLVILMVVAMASFLFVGCLGGVTPDVDVDEDVAVTGVTLDKATLALTVGDASVTLVATVAPADATDSRVIWASSDEAVAIVALGVVTPLNAGISAITATTVDGPFVATCVVTVVAAGEPLPVSTTPVIRRIANVEASLVPIIDLYSSETQYMNEDEVEDGILVFGFAPKYSDIQVYVDGAVVGTGISYGVLEGFIVFVAEDDLGVDGDKTLYATATEVGLDESDASIEYAFTLDTVAPEMVEVAAEIEISTTWSGTATVTFNEAVDEDIAEDEDNWTMKYIWGGEEDISTAELISAKVVELEFDPYWWGDEGDTIRISCGTTEDLAGNEAADLFGYCYLEVEVEEPEPEPTNEAPVITSAAITSGKVGVAYTYDVDATDPDEDILTYSLTEKPLGMAIVAATGEISWDPTDAGSFEVGVKVADPDGLFDVQDFEITVAEADVEPSITNAPVITAIDGILFSDDTHYINLDESDEIVVSGTATPLAEIKIYIDGEHVATDYSDVFGGFGDTIIDPGDLGEDGDKTIYATATATPWGFTESAPSVEYAFTLDTVAPEIEEVTAVVEDPPVIGSTGTVTVTFNEAIDTAGVVGDWTVTDTTTPTVIITVDNAELTLDDEVVELEVTSTVVAPTVGELILVTCTDNIIADLAGNEATDLFGVCELELE